MNVIIDSLILPNDTKELIRLLSCIRAYTKDFYKFTQDQIDSTAIQRMYDTNLEYNWATNTKQSLNLNIFDPKQVYKQVVFPFIDYDTLSEFYIKGCEYGKFIKKIFNRNLSFLKKSITVYRVLYFDKEIDLNLELNDFTSVSYDIEGLEYYDKYVQGNNKLILIITLDKNQPFIHGGLATFFPEENELILKTQGKHLVIDKRDEHVHCHIE